MRIEYRLILVLILTELILTVSFLEAALNGPVKTHYGIVQGLPGRDSSMTSFKGIPFAAPPVGELRWRPPLPPASWREY